MISKRLDVAIHEAIQAHAEQHNGNMLECEQILCGLSAVLACYLAEIPCGESRQRTFRQLCTGIAEITNERTRRNQYDGAVTTS